jgi:DNA (cytosine-5)-methyltransferase 1
MATTKPPYKVPTLPEIRAIAPNGYKVASTFSGAGGSSTGYRLAGFKVVWANEFVQRARTTYKANWPDTFVDPRDIRKIQPADFFADTGLCPGELDLFDGSPPCVSFSASGSRHESWGVTRKYSDTKQRTDDLFYEYARLLSAIQPKVFVAENVSGLVRGYAIGQFKEILARLETCGYRVEARTLDAQWLDVPQVRKRLIFIGVRNDLDAEPAHPKPLKYIRTIADALPNVVKYVMRDRVDKNKFNMRYYAKLHPASTIVAIGLGSWVYVVTRKDEREILEDPTAEPGHPEHFSIREIKALCSFPPDYKLTGNYKQQWERLGRAVPPLMMYRIAATVRDQILHPISGPLRQASLAG